VRDNNRPNAPSFVGENVADTLVLLDVGGLRKINLAKFNLVDLLAVLLRLIVIITNSVLNVWTNSNRPSVIHKLLHRILDKLIERIKLLTHKTLLLEISLASRGRGRESEGVKTPCRAGRVRKCVEWR